MSGFNKGLSIDQELTHKIPRPSAPSLKDINEEDINEITCHQGPQDLSKNHEIKFGELMGKSELEDSGWVFL